MQKYLNVNNKSQFKDGDMQAPLMCHMMQRSDLTSDQICTIITDLFITAVDSVIFCFCITIDYKLASYSFHSCKNQNKTKNKRIITQQLQLRLNCILWIYNEDKSVLLLAKASLWKWCSYLLFSYLSTSAIISHTRESMMALRLHSCLLCKYVT